MERPKHTRREGSSAELVRTRTGTIQRFRPAESRGCCFSMRLDACRGPGPEALASLRTEGTGGAVRKPPPGVFWHRDA